MKRKVHQILAVVILTWLAHTSVFGQEYEFVIEWGTNGNGDGQFIYPTGVAVDSSGNVYVADTGNHRIQKFKSNGVLPDTSGEL